MASDIQLPYRKDVPDPRLPSKLQLVGQVNEGAARFEVNLLSASGEHLFHFCPRFSEGCVVRSSTQGGQWQAEERDGPQPFSAGQQFTLEMDVDAAKIVCSVDGSPFCEFGARDDLSQLAAVVVDGDLQLQSLEVSSTAGGAPGAAHEGGDKGPREVAPDVPPPSSGHAHPAPAPAPTGDGGPAQPPPTAASGPQGALTVPYEAPLQALLQTNRMRVVGTPHPGAQRFTVNFKTADGETLFHFNARFDQHCVVRNASVGKQYPPETEEREGAGCPFQPGRQFALDFLVHGNIIRCFVDGVEFCRFQLRGDLNQVAMLNIHGDLALAQVLIA